MVGFGNVLVLKSNKIVLKKKKKKKIQNHFHILKVLSNLAIIIRRCTHQPSPHTLMDFHTLISKLASPIVKNKDKFVSFDLCVRFSRKKKKIVLTYVFVVQYMFEWSPTFIQEISGVWVEATNFSIACYTSVGSLFFFFFLDSTQVQDSWAPKSVVPVVCWIWLGSSQLCWANYEPSCVQNMDPTTHTYLYMQIYIYCKANDYGTIKK